MHFIKHSALLRGTSPAAHFEVAVRMKTFLAHPAQMVTHQYNEVDGVRHVAHGMLVAFMKAHPWPRMLRYVRKGHTFGEELVLLKNPNIDTLGQIARLTFPRLGISSLHFTTEAQGALNSDADTITLSDDSGGATQLNLWSNPGNGTIGMLVRSKRVMSTMRALLGGDILHYHTKTLVKRPGEGGVWNWHQDYGYWYKDYERTRDSNRAPLPARMSDAVRMRIARMH